MPKATPKQEATPARPSADPAHDLRRGLLAIVGLVLVLDSLQPRAIHTWSAITVQALVALGAVLLLLFQGGGLRRLLRANPFAWPLVAYVAFSIISLLWTPYVDRGLTESVARTEGLLLFLIVAGAGFNRRERAAIFAVAAVVAVIVAGLAIAKDIQGYDAELQLLLENPEAVGLSEEMRTAMIHSLQQGRALGPYGNPNHLANQLALIVPGLLAFVLWGRNLPVRVVCGLAGALLVVGIVLTQSRGGVLALGAGVAVIGLVYLVNRKVAKPGAVAALLLVSAFSLSACDSGRWFHTTTLGPRAQFADVALHMTSDHPALGVGVDGYAVLYSQYRRMHGFEAQYPHNLILQSSTEMGIPGTITAFWIYLAAAVVFLRLVRARQQGRWDIVSLAGLAAVAAFLVHALLDMHNSVPALFHLFCIAAGLAMPVRDENPPLQPLRAPVLRVGLPVAVGVLWVWTAFLPYLAESHYQSANLLQADGQIQASVPQLQAAHRWNPDNVTYLRALAWTYTGIQPDRAVNMLRQAIRANPQQAFLRADLARMEFRRGRTDQALEAIDGAIALHPAEPAYHRTKAELLRELGHNEEAAREEARAEELTPERDRRSLPRP